MIEIELHQLFIGLTAIGITLVSITAIFFAWMFIQNFLFNRQLKRKPIAEKQVCYTNKIEITSDFFLIENKIFDKYEYYFMKEYYGEEDEEVIRIQVQSNPYFETKESAMYHLCTNKLQIALEPHYPKEPFKQQKEVSYE